ncbi:uncharacterized protein ACHE_10920S [Aspergillus chevalieri]|uniref:Uncharacterized protein n=1 Tax=Aspergillus chevalieri TaxID=182096 RepID=A0A7R7VF18_ASPCH|nr:uncharacterized protein ACHE_10920S [Aspergillus chevalieri]BCR83518.1 hypothetical protein ACHE_10920S [Aspergillus chevalieri]
MNTGNGNEAANSQFRPGGQASHDGDGSELPGPGSRSEESEDLGPETRAKQGNYEKRWLFWAPIQVSTRGTRFFGSREHDREAIKISHNAIHAGYKTR